MSSFLGGDTDIAKLKQTKFPQEFKKFLLGGQKEEQIRTQKSEITVLRE